MIILPFDYVKYKNSHYHKDFPHKISWWNPYHDDSEFYETIKENDLPIEYIKWSEDYDDKGYFVYKDILFYFTDIFGFDKEKGEWFMYCESDDGEEDDGRENDAYYLSVDNAKEQILQNFHNNVPGRVCNSVVVFYPEKSAKRYKKGAVEKMRELEGFVVYGKKNLASLTKKLLKSDNTK